MSSSFNQTVCEANAQLLESSFKRGEAFDQQVESFPTVHITLESLRRAALPCETAQSAFLQHNETFWQRLQTAWYGHGVIGALTEICNAENQDKVPSVVKSSSQYLLMSLRWIGSMQFTLYPHLKLTNDQLLAAFSANSNWESSPIRYLAWHSKADKFAIALRDNTVRIHYSGNDIVPILKHTLQRNVTELKWKPLSSSVLAVATQTAILIWNIDSTSLSTRPSTGAVRVLTYAGHSPVTSIEWNPHGLDLLLACSALNSAIVVWNVSRKEPQVIQHVTASGGVSRLLFSPDGSKVLASTPSSSFRVFETGRWTNERWSNLSGRIQTAAWNPAGTVLLFAMSGDPRVYSLTFANSRLLDAPVVDGAALASVAIDLTPIGAADAPEKRNYVHSMIWDESGERLAIMFHMDDDRRHMIELYSVTCHPVLSVTSRGFIKGEEGAAPTFIAFKPNFDNGACLTICYSNGQIKYIPMYFKPSEKRARGEKQFATPLKKFPAIDPRSFLNASQSLWSSPQQAVSNSSSLSLC